MAVSEAGVSVIGGRGTSTDGGSGCLCRRPREERCDPGRALYNGYQRVPHEETPRSR